MCSSDLSGDGWYGASQGLKTAGWQTLVFSKAAFGTEDTPAGWDRIDGVRIAFWRGQAVDSRIRLAKLSGLWHDVAVVIPTARPDDHEVDGALKTAELFSGMLAELGLGCDALDEAAVVRGALEGRRVAVLAYHPRLGREATDALAQFVGAGGKLFACYSVPPQLAELLGLKNLKYFKPEHAGQFAQIRFQADDVPGLPESVRQASWNIISPQGDGSGGARVIGRWYDADGEPTGQAAVLLNENGAFMTHIVLDDDRAGKKQMLAAILGRLDPELWRQMARHELEGIGGAGHCRSVAEVAEYVKQSGVAAAAEQLRQAAAVEETARERFAEAAYAETVAEARRAHELLAEAYLRATASPTREGRAFWNHSGTGAYDGDWDRSARELAAAGFNMVLPNMLWGGRAHYPSDVLPRSATFDAYGDPIDRKSVG